MVHAYNSRIWEVEARVARDWGQPWLHETLCPNKEGREKERKKRQLEEILGALWAFVSWHEFRQGRRMGEGCFLQCLQKAMVGDSFLSKLTNSSSPSHCLPPCLQNRIPFPPPKPPQRECPYALSLQKSCQDNEARLEPSNPHLAIKSHT